MTDKILEKTPEGEILRDFTSEEQAQKVKDKEEFEAKEAERIQKENDEKALKDSARQKLIDGEPLTEEEAKTVVI
tara:strand:- start:146 stop:370 length:225 start_codon:yes stop_codon:yes gene_type:complete